MHLRLWPTRAVQQSDQEVRVRTRLRVHRQRLLSLFWRLFPQKHVLCGLSYRVCLQRGYWNLCLRVWLRNDQRQVLFFVFGPDGLQPYSQEVCLQARSRFHQQCMRYLPCRNVPRSSNLRVQGVQRRSSTSGQQMPMCCWSRFRKGRSLRKVLEHRRWILRPVPHWQDLGRFSRQMCLPRWSERRRRKMLRNLFRRRACGRQRKLLHLSYWRNPSKRRLHLRRWPTKRPGCWLSKDLQRWLLPSRILLCEVSSQYSLRPKTARMRMPSRVGQEHQPDL